MKFKPEPIVYGKQEIGGILVRPNSRQVMEKAVEGHPVDVALGNDYINLYHVFERMVEGDRKRYGHLRLVRKQIAGERWRLYVVGPNDEVPEAPLEDGYDPKRGRYKRYAEQLATGAALVLSPRKEAVK